MGGRRGIKDLWSLGLGPGKSATPSWTPGDPVRCGPVQPRCSFRLRVLHPLYPLGAPPPRVSWAPPRGGGPALSPLSPCPRLFAVTPTTRARTFSAACELPSPSWRFRPCSRLGPHGLGELVTPTGAGVGTGAPAPGLLGGQQGEVSVPPPAPALGRWSEFSSDKDPESLWLGQRGCIRGLFSVGTAVTTGRGPRRPEPGAADTSFPGALGSVSETGCRGAGVGGTQRGPALVWGPLPSRV